jgi:hypothetical protein
MQRYQYTEKVVVPLTKWQREQLEKVAEERGVSFAKITRAALGQFLEQKAVAQEKL